MSRLADAWGRVRALFARRRIDREIDDELRFHLDMLVADNIAAGMTPEEAERAARAALRQRHRGQGGRAGLTWVMRTTGDPTAVVGAARAQVAAIDPDQPIFDVATMDARLARSVAPARFYTGILSAFALVATALAAMGVLGLLAFVVSERTKEIGLRMALGAGRADVGGW
jgi:hypothetical protein